MKEENGKKMSKLKKGLIIAGIALGSITILPLLLLILLGVIAGDSSTTTTQTQVAKMIEETVISTEPETTAPVTDVETTAPEIIEETTEAVKETLPPNVETYVHEGETYYIDPEIGFIEGVSTYLDENGVVQYVENDEYAPGEFEDIQEEESKISIVREDWPDRFVGTTYGEVFASQFGGRWSYAPLREEGYDYDEVWFYGTYSKNGKNFSIDIGFVLFEEPYEGRDYSFYQLYLDGNEQSEEAADQLVGKAFLEYEMKQAMPKY
ncbi:MAG: hypothetical protein LBQ71_15465 [Hungatella sp.]|jgi:hypothetical protein|nr:hypothetical protein [Hungatella sp.]